MRTVEPESGGVPPSAIRYPQEQPGADSRVDGCAATREVSAENEQDETVRAGTASYGLIAVLALVVLLRSTRLATTLFNVYLDAGLQMSPSQIGVLMAILSAMERR